MEISAVAAGAKSIEQVNNVMQKAVEMSMQTSKKILQATVASNNDGSQPNSTTGHVVDTVA